MRMLTKPLFDENGTHQGEKYTSQLQLIEGTIKDRISRGRPRNTWITDLTNGTGAMYYQLKRAAEDRKRWHGLVVNLAQVVIFRAIARQ